MNVTQHNLNDLNNNNLRKRIEATTAYTPGNILHVFVSRTNSGKINGVAVVMHRSVGNVRDLVVSFTKDTTSTARKALTTAVKANNDRKHRRYVFY